MDKKLIAINEAGKILDAWLPSKIKYDKIPGFSIGISYKGKLVYRKGFGYSDTEANKHATAETCYRIASMSKMFTSVAILQLASQGKINLDDKVIKYLPWFKVKNNLNSSERITVKQLLSHSSGSIRDGNTTQWYDNKFPGFEEIKAKISEESLVLRSPAHFKYSNFGFALLGEIVKEVSGKSYNDYITENVIKRLDLKNTYPDLNNEAVKKLSKGYSRPIPGEKRMIFPHIKTNAYASATGFISNVIDLAKFLSAISLENNKAIGISNKLKKEMLREQVKTSSKKENKEYYGLGFDIDYISGRKLVGHGGGFKGFITMSAVDVKNEIAVITLSNSSIPSAPWVNNGIFEIIYNLIDKVKTYGNRDSSVEMAKYGGVYRSHFSDAIVVPIKEVLIAFDPRPHFPVKGLTIFRPKDKEEFVIETENNFDSPGEIVRFRTNKSTGKSFLIWGYTPLEKTSK